MKLLSMTATFGCLENARLELTDGLNLLEMPNESGKSTWCAFLRAMFYGLESRKGGALSERNRYTPWSGAPMAGTVELLWGDKAITLRRFARGSTPFGGFQAVYTGTEEPVSGLSADNVGETLLGVPKEVYQRTCFIPQGGLGIDASGDLERRIAALASAGEEDVSYSEAEGRLRDWRNQRQSNRATGTLPRLRAQLAQTQAQRQRLLDARQKGQEAQAALARLEVERGEVEAELTRHAQLAQADALAAQNARYEAAAQRLAQAEEALAAAQTGADRARSQLPPAPRGRWLCWLPALAALALAAALVLPICRRPELALPLLPGALLPLLLGGVGSWLLCRRRQAAATAHAQGQTRLAQAEALLAQAGNEHIAAQAAWKVISAQGQPPPVPEAGPLPPHGLAESQARRDRLQSAVALYQDQLSRSRGEEEALGGLAPIDQALATLEERVAQEEDQLSALNLALDALAAANAQLQTRFSPALNAKAGALLARLTGGRYTHLSFTRQFQILAQADAGLRSAQLLSQGTADQAYLALRLAVCLLALPPDAAVPLILDDALVTFDDHRLHLALELLTELARERQILLFTCQSRERALLG